MRWHPTLQLVLVAVSPEELLLEKSGTGRGLVTAVAVVPWASSGAHKLVGMRPASTALSDCRAGVDWDTEGLAAAPERSWDAMLCQYSHIGCLVGLLRHDAEKPLAAVERISDSDFEKVCSGSLHWPDEDASCIQICSVQGLHTNCRHM